MFISDLLNLMKKPIKYSFDDTIIIGASIDSRTVVPNNIFFCCNGKKTDGNMFGADALIKGASVSVFDNPKEYEKAIGNKILVQNTFDEIRCVGSKRLGNCCVDKIAITGSFGKTGTKDMLALLLSKSYKVYSTFGNQNNELGVFLTACGMPSDIDVLIFEIGSNSPGEIAALSELIKPDLLVLTGFGHAHIGNFGSISNIISEKISAINSLSSSGFIIANKMFKGYIDERNFKVLYYGEEEGLDASYKDVIVSNLGIDFTVITPDNTLVTHLNTFYRHLCENFLASVLVGRFYNISYELIDKAAREYVIVSGRGNIINLNDKILIDDTYNSSLEAVCNVINSLNIAFSNNLCIVLGGICEIGDFSADIYEKIYNIAVLKNNIRFILIGDDYKRFNSFGNIAIINEENAVNTILNIKEKVVLLKASRAYRFERFVDLLKKESNCAL